MPDKPYDLVVLGSGPGGEAAAVQAARLGASVAVVEIKKSFGGPTGLTSKAVREAAKQINQAVTNVSFCVRVWWCWFSVVLVVLVSRALLAQLRCHIQWQLVGLQFDDWYNTKCHVH